MKININIDIIQSKIGRGILMGLTLKHKDAEPYSKTEILKEDEIDRDRLLASIKDITGDDLETDEEYAVRKDD